MFIIIIIIFSFKFQFIIYQKRDTKIQETHKHRDYQNLKEKRVGITIYQKFYDKEPEDFPGINAFKEKSHIEEVIKSIFINWKLIFN